jgi:hypothetical protein
MVSSAGGSLPGKKQSLPSRVSAFSSAARRVVLKGPVGEHHVICPDAPVVTSGPIKDSPSPPALLLLPTRTPPTAQWPDGQMVMRGFPELEELD